MPTHDLKIEDFNDVSWDTDADAPSVHSNFADISYWLTASLAREDPLLSQREKRFEKLQSAFFSRMRSATRANAQETRRLYDVARNALSHLLARIVLSKCVDSMDFDEDSGKVVEKLLSKEWSRVLAYDALL